MKIERRKKTNKTENKVNDRVLHHINEAHPSANQYFLGLVEYSLGLVVQLIMIYPTALSSTPYFFVLFEPLRDILSNALDINH